MRTEPVEITDKSKETSHCFHILWKFHPFHCSNLLWIRAETPCTPLVSKEGNLWQLALHLVWIQSQCIFPTDFQEIHKVFIMFLVIPSIDDHVISYACDSRNAKEYCIQFPLEHILCNNGTHWKSSLLKSSNV